MYRRANTPLPMPDENVVARRKASADAIKRAINH